MFREGNEICKLISRGRARKNEPNSHENSRDREFSLCSAARSRKFWIRKMRRHRSSWARSRRNRWWQLLPQKLFLPPCVTPHFWRGFMALCSPSRRSPGWDFLTLPWVKGELRVSDGELEREFTNFLCSHALDKLKALGHQRRVQVFHHRGQQHHIADSRN